VVQVLDLGNNIWVVMGRIGGTDPEFPIAPIANQNTYFAQYAIATGNVVGVAEPGFEGFVGSSGSSTDQPVLLAWSYTFLTTNHLTINTAGASTISVTVARSNILHGQRDAVELQLCPHNYNLLPSASITLSTDSFSPVLFRLEVGEIRDVPLPADWVAAIQAGTPTIKGFAVQPAVTTPWEASYAIFDPISGGFRTT
jgi:hypothetical protein